MIEANFYRKRLMFAMIVPAKQKKNWISTFGVQYKFMQLDIMHLINHACRCTAPQIETTVNAEILAIHLIWRFGD